MAKGDRTYIADKNTLDKVYEEVRKISIAVFNAQSFDWGTLFKARETGELFSTKFYKQSVSASATGEKMNDSVGLSCEPSTETVKGTDDFAPHNAFWFVDCDFVVNDDGTPVPTYIEGQNGFKRTGKVDVGILTPPLFYKIEETEDSYIWHLSDKEEVNGLKLTLMPHCRNRINGEPLGYGILPKYYAGEIDGVLYGSSGLAVKNFVSYQSLNPLMQAKGAGYFGAGSERSIFLKVMLRIKYATSSSQKIFSGCTSFNYQYKVAEASEGNYVVLTEEQAANFYVGCTVSIGDPGTNTNYDRGQSYMHSIADKVKVTKIDGAKVYVDKDGMTITDTSYISSMPLHSGQTDYVIGNDGYVANGGKHSFKLQGIEEGIGAYFVSCNEVLNKETATKTVYYAKGTAGFTTSLDTIKADWKEIGYFENEGSGDFWIGDISIDEETGAEIPLTKGSGDSTGTGDRHYYGGTSTGLREHLSRGGLWDGSLSGLSCLSGVSGLSFAFWGFAACVS